MKYTITINFRADGIFHAVHLVWSLIQSAWYVASCGNVEMKLVDLKEGDVEFKKAE